MTMEAGDHKPAGSTCSHIEHLTTAAPSHETDFHDGSEFDGDREVAEEAIGGASTADLPTGYYRSFAFLGTLFGIWMGEIGLLLTSSMPFNVLTQINDDLGPDANYVWVSIVSFNFVLVGRLGGLFGRRWFCMGSLGIGFIGSMIAAFAPDIPALIVGSALLGIAAAPQQSFPMILSELVPNKYRGAVVGGIFLSATPLVCFGPVLVRLMMIHTAGGWRWTYRLGALFDGLSTISLFLAYHPPTFKTLHARRENYISPWAMVDWLGTVLFVAGQVLFLLGLSWGGSVYPWKSGQVLGFVIGGGLIWVAFVLWEIHGARIYPLIPMKLFKNRALMGVVLTAVLWPIQLQALYTQRLWELDGKAVSVNQSGTVIGTILSAVLIQPLGRHKLQLVFGVVVLCAFCVAMAAANTSTEAMALAFITIVGTCIGWIENAAQTLAPFCLKHEDLGIALGLVGTSRATLSAIAQVVYVSTLNNKLSAAVPQYVLPAAIEAGLPSSSGTALLDGLATVNLTDVPGITPAIAAAAAAANKHAYTYSFKYVYLASIAFGCVGVLFSLMAPDSEKSFNSTVSRKLQRTGVQKESSVKEH
ncbi:fungal trichothecene efflux pump [Aspergillus unguis]